MLSVLAKSYGLCNILCVSEVIIMDFVMFSVFAKSLWTLLCPLCKLTGMNLYMLSVLAKSY